MKYCRILLKIEQKQICAGRSGTPENHKNDKLAQGKHKKLEYLLSLRDVTAFHGVRNSFDHREAAAS